jgi:hypothetical protein
MERIVVELYGVPFNPTYEIDDGIKIGDKVRVPGSSGMIDDGDIGTVVAIGSDYDGPCKRAENYTRRISRCSAAKRGIQDDYK